MSIFDVVSLETLGLSGFFQDDRIYAENVTKDIIHAS